MLSLLLLFLARSQYSDLPVDLIIPSVVNGFWICIHSMEGEWGLLGAES